MNKPKPIDLSDQPRSVQDAFRDLTERADKAEAALAAQRTAHIRSLLRSELAQLDIQSSAAAESAISLILADASDIEVRTVNGCEEVIGTLGGRTHHCTVGIAAAFIDANPHYTKAFHDAQHAAANVAALAQGTVPRGTDLTQFDTPRLLEIDAARAKREAIKPKPATYDAARWGGLALHELTTEQMLAIDAESRGAA